MELYGRVRRAVRVEDRSGCAQIAQAIRQTIQQQILRRLQMWFQLWARMLG